MQRITSRTKLFTVALASMIAITATTWALGDPSPPKVASQNHLPLSALVYEAPTPLRATTRAPIYRQERASRASIRPPAVHTQPTAPAGSVRARVLAAWPGDDVWVDHVVSHESGYDPHQYGGMRNGDCCWGLFQFSLGTYHSYGGRGNPINASPEEQTRIAWRAFLADGSQPWTATAPWYVPPHHG